MDSPRKHDGLYVAPEADVVLRILGMGHTHGVLFDNRAFIKIGGHIMRRGTDQFYTALIGLLIGVRAFERWQERVMDIDDPAGHFLTQPIDRTCM